MRTQRLLCICVAVPGLLHDYMESGGELARKLLRAYGKLRMDPCCSTASPGTFNRH